MKKLLVALFISTILLSGCSSSVSQEDYDAKVKELESVQKELADLKEEKAQKGIDQAAAKAWVSESFGDNASCTIMDNDLYVSLNSGYTLSEKSIEALWNDINAALSLYGAYYRESPEQLPYDSVTILVLEEETGLDMISFQFIKAADGSFSQNTSMVNLQDINEIVPYLNNALK